MALPICDIYMAMKLGTVDGCFFTFAEFYNAKLSEVTDYVMEQPASGSGFVSFIISKKAWDELPKDLQKAAIRLNVAPAKDPHARRSGWAPDMSRKRRAQSAKKATPRLTRISSQRL